MFHSAISGVDAKEIRANQGWWGYTLHVLPSLLLLRLCSISAASIA